jgi:hypothetical protein
MDIASSVSKTRDLTRTLKYSRPPQKACFEDRNVHYLVIVLEVLAGFSSQVRSNARGNRQCNAFENSDWGTPGPDATMERGQK